MKKTALITGASSGLGLEFTSIYAREGFDLVIVARREKNLLRLKEELEAEYRTHVWVFVQDLSLPDAASRIYQFTVKNDLHIDALINNAGFGDFGDFWKFDMQKQTALLQVNITAMVQLTRYFLPEMVHHGNGHVLNLSSVASFCAGPRMSLYYASKEFVRSFSEAVAEELKGTGVTVTALCPGPTETGFEKAAEMKNSKMFTFFRPLTPKAVAEAGYQAAIRGKVLKYYGVSTKLMNIGARLMPRSLSRRFAGKING